MSRYVAADAPSARRDGRAPRVNQINLGYLSLPQGARVLDLGCARGEQTILLAEHGFDVVGADIAVPTARSDDALLP